MSQIQLTINETTWGVTVDGKTVVNGIIPLSLEPKTVYHNKHGRRVMPTGQGKFQNPDWVSDGRKPRHLTDEQAAELTSRMETSQEIAARAINIVSASIMQLTFKSPKS